jgi:hypothetical protein
MKMTSKQEFWITNCSPRNVTLADLALNIKSFSTINLLDSNHYTYTIEQLLKSKESGSLYNKRHLVKVREVSPLKKEISQIPILRNTSIPDRQRSLYKMNAKEYEELKVSVEDQKKQDEIYAQENADLAELDEQRSFVNLKKV